MAVKRINDILIWATLMILTLRCDHRANSLRHDGSLRIEFYEEGTDRPFKSFDHTFSDILTLPADTVSVMNPRSLESETWKGIPFKEWIESASAADTDRIQKILVEAPDGYFSVIFGPLLEALPSSYLMYSGQAGSSQPPSTQLIFKELKQFYWVNSPNRINITLRDTSAVHEPFRLSSVQDEMLTNL